MKDDLLDISKYYDIPKCVRRIIITYFNVRDVKRMFRKSMNIHLVINDVDDIIIELIPYINGQEVYMSVSKQKLVEVKNELLLADGISEYL